MKTINKEIITEKALELFRKKGYKNVTVDEICMSCDITKPTFYHYVPAKEELILNVYDDIIQHLLGDMSDIAGISSFYEQLTYIFSRLLKGTTDFGYDLVSQLFIANFKENRHSFDLRDQLTKVALSLIENAQSHHEIANTSEPAEIYNALGHMFTGYVVMWCITQGSNHVRENFFKAMDSLFNPITACDYKKYM